MKNKDIALTDAQRSMVEANMDVVRWAIRTSIQVNEQRYGFGYDDLFQEGCIWLCKAAVTYDPDGGASFPTYAQRVVENGLRTYCRLQRSVDRQEHLYGPHKLSLTAHPRHELYQAVTHQISPTHAPVRR